MAQEGGVTLSGFVRDQSGGAIPQATLKLTPKGGGSVRSIFADDQGNFSFANVTPGPYVLEANADGFQSAPIPVTVGPALRGPVQVIMKIRTQEEEVTVSAQSPGVSVDPAANASSVKLEQTTLGEIPADSENILPVLSNFLSPASHGVMGPSIVVDGVESEGLDVPASTIKHIRLDRNPYSVRFRRPGTSRVEVTTQEGHRKHYHGGIAAYGRDSNWDARNAFAQTKAPLRKALVDADLTGPIPGIPASFFVSGERLADDESAVVNAHLPDGPFVTNAPTIQNRTNALGRIDLHPSKYHSIFASYFYSGQSQSGLGVGGIRLPEQSYGAAQAEHSFQISDRYISLKGLINELRVKYEWIHDQSGQPAAAPAVQVEGDFLGGPSQTYRIERRSKVSVQDSIQYVRGIQSLIFGAEVHPRSIRSVDASNFAGTYYFYSIDRFDDGKPSQFNINRGLPAVDYNQDEGFGFLQDEIKVRPNLDLTVGARYEWHNDLSRGNVVAPRLGIAFAPFGEKTVLRAGAGLFYDEYPRQVIRQKDLYDGIHVQQWVITAPLYPDPFAGGALTAPPPSVVRTAYNLTVPRLLQASFAVDQALNAKTQLTVEFRALRGEHLYRSRDVNAPYPPDGIRPDPNFLNIVQVESSAMMKSKAMEVTLRWDASRRISGTAQYVLSRTVDDTSGPLALPADSYNLRREIGRADYDRRHRFNLMGNLLLPWQWNIGALVSLGSSIPYNITTGRDNNEDTFVTDRPPGVGRNTGIGPDLARVDLRLTKSFNVWGLIRNRSKEHNNLSFSIDAFNVFNHTNFNNYIGVLRSHFFGLPNSALPGREIQFSIRYRM